MIPTMAQMMERDRKIAAQIDGHYCYDWDEMAVSAWTPEYDCCSDFKKTRLGRIINRFVMWRFNLGWWWVVGQHAKKLKDSDFVAQMWDEINSTKVPK